MRLKKFELPGENLRRKTARHSLPEAWGVPMARFLSEGLREVTRILREKSVEEMLRTSCINDNCHLKNPIKTCVSTNHGTEMLTSTTDTARELPKPVITLVSGGREISFYSSDELEQIARNRRSEERIASPERHHQVIFLERIGGPFEGALLISRDDIAYARTLKEKGFSCVFPGFDGEQGMAHMTVMPDSEAVFSKLPMLTPADPAAAGERPERVLAIPCGTSHINIYDQGEVSRYDTGLRAAGEVERIFSSIAESGEGTFEIPVKDMGVGKKIDAESLMIIEGLRNKGCTLTAQEIKGGSDKHGSLVMSMRLP